MTTLTIVALAGAIFAVGIGFATIVGESGYRFDLRRNSRRKGKDGRLTGRRGDDRLTA